MVDKKFTISPGGKVIIEIGRPTETRKPFTGHLSAKGLIQSRREDDYLPRRLKVLGGINFYDLGQILSAGVFVDLAFNVTPTITQVNGFLESGAPTLADYKNLTDLILTVGAANLAANYRKFDLDRGGYFNPVIIADAETIFLATAPAWTAEGLKLTETQLAADDFTIAQGNEIFSQIKLVGSGKNKITALYDYAAAAVAFTPGKSDIYFFVPLLMRLTSTGSYTESGTQTRISLIGDIRPMPRVPLLDAASEHYKKTFNNSSSLNDPSDAKYLEVLRIIRLIKEAATGQVSRKATYNGIFWSYASQSQGVYPNEPPFGSLTRPASAFLIGAGFSSFPVAGSLAAIIKQGEDLFYVWS